MVAALAAAREGRLAVEAGGCFSLPVAIFEISASGFASAAEVSSAGSPAARSFLPFRPFAFAFDASAADEDRLANTVSPTVVPILQVDVGSLVAGYGAKVN